MTNATMAWAGRKLNHSQKLLTNAQVKALPALYATDEDENAEAQVKFFWGNMTWYAFEFDAESGQFFGLVDNAMMRDQMPGGELGYFSADELISASEGQAFPIERDLHFEPATLAEIREKI